MIQSNYLPFGFRYPAGFPYSESNPDPGIETIRLRMQYLNEIHALTTLPGHIFAAAMKLFQQESQYDVDLFWDKIRASLTKEEVAEVAQALAEQVINEPPRLDFPNTVALFDCRFVSTAEWEFVRHYSIGGSDAAAVLGVSKYHSPRTLYYEKTSPPPKVDDVGRQHILDYGHAVESYVVNEICSRLGAVHYPEYRMFSHKDYCFITCNPDAILMFPDGSLALFEAKTAMWLKRAEWKEGIPPYYAPQPRQYLEVLNDPRLSKGYIGVCLGGLPKDMLCHSYERDKQAGEAQIQTVVDYWNSYIIPGEIPPFSGNADMDFDAVYSYIQHDQKAVDSETLPADSISDFERYFALKDEKAELDKQIKGLKAQETLLLEQIRQSVDDGLTVCSIPNGMTYLIKCKDTKRASANMTAISAADPKAAKLLEVISATMREPTSFWTNPKITRRAIKGGKKGANQP